MEKISFLVFVGLLASSFTLSAQFFTKEGLDTLAKEKENGTFHYVLSTTGEEVFPGEWEGAEDFSCGRALVHINDSLAYLDGSGNVVIKGNYYWARSFEDGYAVVDTGWEYQGLIDRSGNIILKLEYTSIGSLSEGLRSVAKGDSLGFVDEKGNQIIPFKFSYQDGYYTELCYFSDGVCAVCTNQEDAFQISFIDKTGKILFDMYGPTWGGAGQVHYPVYSDGLCVYNDNEKFGYVDKKGKLVIPASFDGADDFSEGLAAVRQGEKVFFIDKSGKQAVPGYYGGYDEGALGFLYGKFHNGTAIVNLNTEIYKEDGRNFWDRVQMAIINTKGEIIRELPNDW